jgi:hypothetical protein
MRKTNVRRALFPLSALLFSAPAFAQQTDDQLWLQTNVAIPVSDKATVTLESIGRFSDRAGGFAHDEFGGFVSLKVAKNIEIGAGYRHVDDYDHGVAKPNEERLRQIIIFTLGHGFATRLRFEQRFNSAGGEVGFRLRPQLRFTLPLKADGPSLFATHEDFINFNTTGWGQRAGHERMRNAVGVSVPLVPKISADIGYLNQYRFGRGGARDQMDHVGTFALTLKL